MSSIEKIIYLNNFGIDFKSENPTTHLRLESILDKINPDLIIFDGLYNQKKTKNDSTKRFAEYISFETYIQNMGLDKISLIKKGDFDSNTILNPNSTDMIWIPDKLITENPREINNLLYPFAFSYTKNKIPKNIDNEGNIIFAESSESLEKEDFNFKNNLIFVQNRTQNTENKLLKPKIIKDKNIIFQGIYSGFPNNEMIENIEDIEDFSPYTYSIINFSELGELQKIEINQLDTAFNPRKITNYFFDDNGEIYKEEKDSLRKINDYSFGNPEKIILSIGSSMNSASEEIVNMLQKGIDIESSKKEIKTEKIDEVKTTKKDSETKLKEVEELYRDLESQNYFLRTENKQKTEAFYGIKNSFLKSVSKNRKDLNDLIQTVNSMEVALEDSRKANKRISETDSRIKKMLYLETKKSKNAFETIDEKEKEILKLKKEKNNIEEDLTKKINDIEYNIENPGFFKKTLIYSILFGSALIGAISSYIVTDKLNENKIQNISYENSKKISSLKSKLKTTKMENNLLKEENNNIEKLKQKNTNISKAYSLLFNNLKEAEQNLSDANQTIENLKNQKPETIEKIVTKTIEQKPEKLEYIKTFTKTQLENWNVTTEFDYTKMDFYENYALFYNNENLVKVFSTIPLKSLESDDSEIRPKNIEFNKPLFEYLNKKIKEN